MSDQLKMESGKSGGPVECLGMTFESEDARRDHFLNLLAEIGDADRLVVY